MRFLERMRMPISAFKRNEMDVVVGAAKRCLNTPEGETLLKHLIVEYRLDEPVGCMEGAEGAYVNGTQDVVKYIIGLTNDK